MLPKPDLLASLSVFTARYRWTKYWVEDQTGSMAIVPPMVIVQNVFRTLGSGLKLWEENEIKFQHCGTVYKLMDRTEHLTANYDESEYHKICHDTYSKKLIRPCFWLIFQTFGRPPTWMLPVIATITRPASIITDWNTSVQTTAFRPPWRINTPMIEEAVQSLLCLTEWRMSWFNGSSGVFL